ncbi:RNA polymerase sigma factor, FliA/WhiG/SigD family protein [Plesiocystis pacifica SIR-1]|uniref:RNA polymerase sigma factor, FliA/WhiG/SigD family protein n=1 Tax=Plesiocystis pacifica SIR-1 TaxID=391625 RepID=A6G6D9_9BACT|nr:sigma-70 family RNA polymerase sigma factor [Plesiocystis pacifica]EDM78568.1 RNA polymerase sigma factor, FliA/WhiG/SigD family protein [Plesiocystis pacifica SIR-1]
MSPPLSDAQAARVEAHTQLVERLARALSRQLRALSVEELESVGNEALVVAAMRFDPSAGASFSTFAHYRIRGAMIDAVRKRSPGRRRKQRAIQRLEATQLLMRQAAEDRGAKRAGGGRESLEQRVHAARELVYRAGLAILIAEATHGGLAVAPSEDTDPEQRVLKARQIERLRAAIAALEPESRELIVGLYVHGKTGRELAEQLGVSAATLSRRHSRLLERLGQALRGA